jgi:hypothetical protein
VSGLPQVIEAGRMRSMESMTVIVKRRDRPARQWKPFAHYCVDPKLGTLGAGESLYEPLFIGAGTNGWLIDEPGTYLVQVALHLNDRDVVSNPLYFRVAPPLNREEEVVAQDVFTDSVGRIINFSGSLAPALASGNDALQEVVERLDDAHPAAIHARYALGSPIALGTKQVVASDQAERNGHGRLAIKGIASKTEGTDLVESALTADMQAAARTFGHIGFRRRVERYAEALEQHKHKQDAKAVCKDMLATLKDRGVPEHILKSDDEK